LAATRSLIAACRMLSLMPLIVDFLLPRKPVSHQAALAVSKQAWRDYVFGRARAAWPGRPLTNVPLKFTMVYLSRDENPGDVNNFVKPVQDALNALVYADDSMIRDVSAHLRSPRDSMAIELLPEPLAIAATEGMECVYVAISDSLALHEELR
jgi:hypothetical protein